MALKFQKLKVAKVVKETPDAVTISFSNPDKNLFQYKPGQYLTLKVFVNGKPYNRAYSLCSCPFADDNLSVTVKVTEGGIVSTYLNQYCKEGMEIDVLPPLGNFVAKIDPSHKKQYVLIGAGSGITPLMSILRSVIEKEPQSKVMLLYGNRNENYIIFKNELQRLTTQFPERLKVIHSLSRPEAQWTGFVGRLDRNRVKEILNKELQNTDLQKEYFICGPSGMMDEAGHALKEMNVPAEQVHEEHFSAPVTHPMEEENGVRNETISGTATGTGEGNIGEVTVILEGQEVKITVNPSQSILDAVLDVDLDPPYACMIGSCCTCKAKLVSGKVIMDDREGLTDEEIADGYVLTCQSHPVTPNVVVNYDQI
jgi:ring-1,2-phenylacetyl-CoA epoxidase subunit PaaE